MKKIYIKPTIETTHIALEQVIAVSGGGLTFDPDNNNGRGPWNDEYADEILSKRRGIWDLEY